MKKDEKPIAVRPIVKGAKNPKKPTAAELATEVQRLTQELVATKGELKSTIEHRLERIEENLDNLRDDVRNLRCY